MAWEWLERYLNAHGNLTRASSDHSPNMALRQKNIGTAVNIWKYYTFVFTVVLVYLQCLHGTQEWFYGGEAQIQAGSWR